MPVKKFQFETDKERCLRLIKADIERVYSHEDSTEMNNGYIRGLVHAQQIIIKEME